ncbi:XkdQ/YqbQ family protein [Paenibacillus agricola]|uniref:YqbQ/XkdQ domain-containing protein n=1 Tax=Paenibacillus agricola TaxID=2716264 RepID=A0ABX0JBP2_9BACL|nr:hypothetical protein [Paenibacillus agricola]NHN31125.1 hypothetical protein [Paenibacillus agricola]
MTSVISVVYANDVYLDPIVTGVTWSGEITQGYRSLDVTLRNTLDGVTRAVDIELGGELRLYSDDIELFRGIIFTHSINEKGDMSLTAHDENVYLVKNSDGTRKFTAKKASDIIRDLCASFEVEIGDIVDTGYVIPRLLFKNKTLWDMITTALTETRRQTGRRFLVSAKEGALYLTERGEKIVDYILEDGVNILGASYGQSIEDMRNSIKVSANEDAKPKTAVSANLPPEALDMLSSAPTATPKSEKKPLFASAKDDALVARFGLMQHPDQAGAESTQSSVNQLAAELLAEMAVIKDEASVEVLGNVEVTSGSAVYVIESLTGIVGGFYVITDSHTWSNGVHRMSLKISGDESLPTMKYEDLEDAKKEKAASTKKKKSGADDATYAAALARLGE